MNASHARAERPKNLAVAALPEVPGRAARRDGDAADVEAGRLVARRVDARRRRERRDEGLDGGADAALVPVVARDEAARPHLAVERAQIREDRVLVAVDVEEGQGFVREGRRGVPGGPLQEDRAAGSRSA